MSEDKPNAERSASQGLQRGLAFVRERQIARNTDKKLKIESDFVANLKLDAMLFQGSGMDRRESFIESAHAQGSRLGEDLQSMIFNRTLSEKGFKQVLNDVESQSTEQKTIGKSVEDELDEPLIEYGDKTSQQETTEPASSANIVPQKALEALEGKTFDSKIEKREVTPEPRQPVQPEQAVVHHLVDEPLVSQLHTTQNNYAKLVAEFDRMRIDLS